MTNKKISLSKNLLSSLACFIKKSGTAMVDIQKWQSAYLTGGGEYVQILKKNYRLSSVKRSLYNLKRRQFITTKKIGKQLLISLTNKGRLSIMIKELTNAPKLKDGQGTILIFDVPEKARGARQTLRYWLRAADFSIVQKSVWLTNRDVAQILKNVFKQLGLWQWIKVYLVKNID